MSYSYRPELLAPYLTLDQGEKIQAECMFYSSPASPLALKLIHAPRRLGRR